MNHSEISHRYARVLLNLTESEGVTERLLNAFGSLEILLKKPSEFMHFMLSPQFDHALKIDLLKRSLGPDHDQILMTFLLFLIQKKRIVFLPEILKEYQRLAAEKLGILNVRLITAAALDAETSERLARKLEELFRKKTQIKQEINQSLIGGGILMIGNKSLDASIKGKLLRLKKHLLRGAP